MKVGTDGVLLGAWADVSNVHSILDIGTGTGLIALMLAQRCRAQIEAVELDPKAAQQAQNNFQNSPWASRLACFENDVNQFMPTGKYDLIVSNPPYFPNNDQMKSPTRQWARNTGLLSHESLFHLAKQWLGDDGTFALIYPHDLKDLFLSLAKENHLHPKRITFIRGQPNSLLTRILTEFSFQKTIVEQNELIVEHRRNDYTQDYIDLTKTFYLKM